MVGEGYVPAELAASPTLRGKMEGKAYVPRGHIRGTVLMGDDVLAVVASSNERMNCSSKQCLFVSGRLGRRGRH